MFSIGQNTHDSFITIWTSIKNLWQANVNHAHSGHFLPATVWKVAMDVLHTKCAIKLVIEWGLPNKDIKETKLSALMINALRRNCMKFCNSGTKRTVYNIERCTFLRSVGKEMFYYVRKFTSEAENDLHTFRLSYENQSCKNVLRVRLTYKRRLSFKKRHPI